MSSTLAKIRNDRLGKVEKLRELGINPYPARADKEERIRLKKINKKFDEYKGKNVTAFGRIMSWREHGALKFANIQDYTGKIQLIMRKDDLEGKFSKDRQLLGWKELKLIDVGDFVQVRGEVLESKTGENSIEVREFRILTKAIRPLPEKWEGIKDTETRYRRRYLDMTMNKEVRDRFERKATFWNTIREFLNDNEFIEVNIPVLEHVTGGADANPFVTHYDALDQDFYLRISHELPLKRLIGGGFEKVYDIGARFRNEGFSDEHLPEHVALEWYCAYADYHDGMDMLEEMFKKIVKNLYGKLKFKIKGFDVDFGKKWERIKFNEILNKRFKVDVYEDSVEKMNKILKENGVDLGDETNRNRVVDNLWKLIRKDIGGPAFLIEHPKFLSPLSKSNDENPMIVDRGQPIVAGSELGNFWSELNDPVDQYERFKEQQDMRDAGDDEAQMMDIDYVEMLEYGMPPCVGFGISERIFWYLESVTAKEGVAFPPVRAELEETTKEIYGINEVRKVSASSRNKFDKSIKNLRNIVAAKGIDDIDDSKIIEIDKKLLESYENINIGIAVIKGVKVEKKNSELEKLKKKTLSGIRKTLSLEAIDDIPQIESYMHMYKRMGVDTGSRKASPEALLRRVVEGEGIYNVNTCVDAYNIAVLLTQVSTGAFDLETLKFPVVVREARNGEKIEIIGGEKKKLKDGEVCYFDQNGAYNIDYNWRDADRTKVTEKTKDLWINVEGVNSITRDQVADTLKLAVELITRFCGGSVGKVGLVKNK
ncbi:lysine--tRNA ligase [Candidatus Dojkabacteria bacterium]|nr:lysine--tRNA ligase [Candidatus Dojkabacteria bacterium]